MTTETAKHTPGPWEAAELPIPFRDGRKRFLVTANERETIIAEVYRAEDKPLVAAVPDLLEACKAAVVEINEGGSMGSALQCLKLLSAAIAKAEA